MTIAKLFRSAYGFALPAFPCVNGREFVGKVVRSHSSPPTNLRTGDTVCPQCSFIPKSKFHCFVAMLMHSGSFYCYWLSWLQKIWLSRICRRQRLQRSQTTTRAVCSPSRRSWCSVCCCGHKSRSLLRLDLVAQKKFTSGPAKFSPRARSQRHTWRHRRRSIRCTWCSKPTSGWWLDSDLWW